MGRPGRIGPTGWWEKSIWIIQQTLVDQEDTNDHLAHFQLNLKETDQERAPILQFIVLRNEP